MRYYFKFLSIFIGIIVAASLGEGYGGAIRIVYPLRTPIEGKIQEFDCEEGKFQLNDKDPIVVNQRKVKKFSFERIRHRTFFEKKA